MPTCRIVARGVGGGAAVLGIQVQDQDVAPLRRLAQRRARRGEGMVDDGMDLARHGVLALAAIPSAAAAGTRVAKAILQARRTWRKGRRRAAGFGAWLAGLRCRGRHGQQRGQARDRAQQGTDRGFAHGRSHRIYSQYSQIRAANSLTRSPSRALLPALQRDAVRSREVGFEHGLHLRAELRPQDDGVDLVVVQEAAPVEVGRADGRPHAVDQRRLRVQQRTAALVDLAPRPRSSSA